MGNARVRKHPPLRLELRLPSLQLLPGLRVDPLQAFTGRSLEELLAPVLEKAPQTSAGKTRYQVALPDGAGVSIPLGNFGEVGFHYDAGHLQITAPALAAMVLRGLPHQVGGPEIISTPNGRLSRFSLAPPVGEVFQLPLGATALDVVRL